MRGCSGRDVMIHLILVKRARRGRGRQPPGHRVFGQLRNPNHLQNRLV
jgi:hypothetical protein